VFDSFVQPHSCITYAHMVLIIHLYSRSLFSMDFGPKSRTFPVVLSLASDALFHCVSAMSISDRGITPSILLRFEPVLLCY
jgi:hypothetical protein